MYLWHCDREGRYSMYSQGVEDENYLRGVQEAGDDGTVTFTSIFPACYSGRWPHVHFEVFSSAADAVGDGRPLVTSQLALPEAVCEEVFATDGYSSSVRNLSQVSLDQRHGLRRRRGREPARRGLGLGAGRLHRRSGRRRLTAAGRRPTLAAAARPAG